MLSPLSDDQIREAAPSVFAMGAAPSVSDRYAYIPSYPIVRALRLIGMHPVEARQGFKKSPDGVEFAVHRLRFQKFNGAVDWAQETSKLGGLIPEVLLLNSHDRTSPLTFSAGLKRLVCLNGMTVADASFSFAMRHVGKRIVGDAIANAQAIVGRFGEIVDTAKAWQGIEMSEDLRAKFAKGALEARGTSIDIDPKVLLNPRNFLDHGNDLWAVYNRAQENLTKGGAVGVNAQGSVRSLRGVKSLLVDIEMNRKLWLLAKSFAGDLSPSQRGVVEA